MSLIDEALKRARDQKPPEAAPDAPRTRRTPDPWAYAPLPHAGRRVNPRGWIIAGSIGAIAAAAAAGVWLSRSGGAPARGAHARGTASGAIAGTGKVSSTIPTAAPSPVPLLRRTDTWDPRSPDAAAARPGPERPPSARGRAPGRGAGTGTADSPGRSEPPPQLLPQPASRAFDGRTYVGALVAPNGARVELGGIVYSETNASALLNGRILPVGGVVEGLTISSIEEDRVELTGDGLTVHLTLR